MKYADARDRIKSGDMLLWRDHPGGGTRSVIERWFVRHGTASPYTHVGVAWVEHGRVMVMDITTKGCAPRPLSANPDFDWSPAPRELSPAAMAYAASCWGEWQYSRWQAILGQFKRLVIGADSLGQCAEYALAIWKQDSMAPTSTATPAGCADGALEVWDSGISHVTFGCQ